MGDLTVKKALLSATGTVLIVIAVCLLWKHEVVEEMRLKVAVARNDVEALAGLLLNARSSKIRVLAYNALRRESNQPEVSDILVDALLKPDPKLLPCQTMILSDAPGFEYVGRRFLYTLLLFTRLGHESCLVDKSTEAIEACARTSFCRLTGMPDQPPPSNQRLESWWKKNAPYIRWSAKKRRFIVDENAKRTKIAIDSHTGLPLTAAEWDRRQCEFAGLQQMFKKFAAWWQRYRKAVRNRDQKP